MQSTGHRSIKRHRHVLQSTGHRSIKQIHQVDTAGPRSVASNLRLHLYMFCLFLCFCRCQPVNDNLMELLLTVGALRRASAGRISGKTDRDRIQHFELSSPYCSPLSLYVSLYCSLYCSSYYCSNNRFWFNESQQ